MYSYRLNTVKTSAEPDEHQKCPTH